MNEILIEKEEEPPSLETEHVQDARLQASESKIGKAFWLWVLCLLGVDYFSTLSYQPSFTYHSAGLLGPIATFLLVLITLFAVLPLYCRLAKLSPHGEGVVALLERLISGWRGKTLILVLLGFAATDFIMLKSISLADAAQHLLKNTFVAESKPFHAAAHFGKEYAGSTIGSSLQHYFTPQLLVTLLLGILSFGFWFLMRKGFNRKVIFLAVPIVGLYLLLNSILIGSCIYYLSVHPEYWAGWQAQLADEYASSSTGMWRVAGWGSLALVVCLVLPQLSLGFSGFEMSMILMPQIRGEPRDTADQPAGRIRKTRFVLICAAVVMSVYLLASSFATTLLIPPAAFAEDGAATNRALAYLAHGEAMLHGQSASEVNPWFGPLFGSIYDFSTILILCFAGTSVMTALARLLPRILLRFGMELQWADRWGVLFLLFAFINLLITLSFHAHVEHQRGAYATGVLAMVLSASVVVAGQCWNDRSISRKSKRLGWFYVGIATLFAAMFLGVLLSSPTGLLIACCFIALILGTSIVSRALRSHEPRTVGFAFADERSKLLWDSLRAGGFPILIPHRPGRHHRLAKESMIRQDHQLDPTVEMVFIEVEVDDPSNFYQKLMINILHEDNNFIIKVTQCVSIAHAIAAIALELSKHADPPGLHFGWSEMDLLAASWSYLAFGEGNVPWKVRELIQEIEPNVRRQPRIVIG